MSLPLTSTSSHQNRRTRFGRAPRIFSLGRRTEISRRGFSLQLESTSFNAAHDTLLETLSREESVVGAALRSLYDVGALVGILGLISGLVLLLWSLVRTVAPETLPTGPSSDNQGAGFSSSASGVAIFDHSSTSQLRPIVPGFTVPFFHAPVILVALFVSQVVHELGHAIAAAADATPLHSVGASLTFIIPSAHVALSNSDGSSLRSKLRVATAGAWHNLLAWLLLLVLSKVPISGLSYWTLGGYGLYEDVGSLGISVLAVKNDSPLQGHIPPASVITRVDDTRLSSAVATPDTWDKYLTSSAKDSVQGWCVSRNWYKVQTSSCCKLPVGNATASDGQNGLCFIPPSAFAAPSEISKADAHLASGRCVDPIALFQTSAEATKTGEAILSTSRCDTVCMSTSRNPNEEDEICIRPRKDLELLRITILPPPWYSESPTEEKEKLGNMNSNSRTVVWNGPKEEVWQQLTVGKLRPKAHWVPVYLPVWTQLFFKYFQIITLSLFIFNLLPIPKLDGGIILSIVLDIMSSMISTTSASRQYEYSTELMEKGEESHLSSSSTSSRSGGLRWQVERGIGLGTIGLLVLVCLFSMWREISAG